MLEVGSDGFDKYHLYCRSTRTWQSIFEELQEGFRTYSIMAVHQMVIGVCITKFDVHMFEVRGRCWPCAQFAIESITAVTMLKRRTVKSLICVQKVVWIVCETICCRWVLGLIVRVVGSLVDKRRKESWLTVEAKCKSALFVFRAMPDKLWRPCIKNQECTSQIGHRDNLPFAWNVGINEATVHVKNYRATEFIQIDKSRSMFVVYMDQWLCWRKFIAKALGLNEH
jgi:hypothetical protein